MLLFVQHLKLFYQERLRRFFLYVHDYTLANKDIMKLSILFNKLSSARKNARPLKKQQLKLANIFFEMKLTKATSEIRK